MEKKNTHREALERALFFSRLFEVCFLKNAFFSHIRSRVQLIHTTPPPFPACSCHKGILHQLGCLLYTGWRKRICKISRFAYKDPKSVGSVNQTDELDGHLAPLHEFSLQSLYGYDHFQVYTDGEVYCKGTWPRGSPRRWAQASRKDVWGQTVMWPRTGGWTTSSLSDLSSQIPGHPAWQDSHYS